MDLCVSYTLSYANVRRTGTPKDRDEVRKRKKSMALGKMFGSIFPVTSGREEG